VLVASDSMPQGFECRVENLAAAVIVYVGTEARRASSHWTAGGTEGRSKGPAVAPIALVSRARASLAARTASISASAAVTPGFVFAATARFGWATPTGAKSMAAGRLFSTNSGAFLRWAPNPVATKASRIGFVSPAQPRSVAQAMQVMVIKDSRAIATTCRLTRAKLGQYPPRSPLVIRILDFPPRIAPAGLVPAVDALRDNAFEPHAAGVPEHGLAVLALHVLAEAQPGPCVLE
jgi:hypothetical protein